jgi:hypothetical protein
MVLLLSARVFLTTMTLIMVELSNPMELLEPSRAVATAKRLRYR